MTGAVLFGLGDVTLLSGDTVPLAERAAAGAGRRGVRRRGAVSGLAAGGLFVSTLTENAIAAMATTIGLAALIRRCSTPCRSCRRSTRGCSPTTGYGFGELLRGSVDAGALLRWSALHLAYAAVFLALAWARLTTKDVTS